MPDFQTAMRWPGSNWALETLEKITSRYIVSDPFKRAVRHEIESVGLEIYQSQYTKEYPSTVHCKVHVWVGTASNCKFILIDVSTGKKKNKDEPSQFTTVGMFIRQLRSGKILETFHSHHLFICRRNKNKWFLY